MIDLRLIKYYKVFRLPKTLFIQVFFFYSSRCLFLLYRLVIGCTMVVPYRIGIYIVYISQHEPMHRHRVHSISIAQGLFLYCFEKIFIKTSGFFQKVLEHGQYDLSEEFLYHHVLVHLFRP